MNKKLNAVLLWVGAAGAVISSIAYITVMAILVMGITTSMHLEQLLLVSIIGGVAGILITVMLRIQGVILASNEEESKQVMKAYRVALNKGKKPRSLKTITWYMNVKFVGDVLLKATTVAASTYFMISIFTQGNGDMALIGLAFANTFMFLSFGILALRGAYQFYTEEHLNAIRERTEQILEEQNKINVPAFVPEEEEINELQI